MRNSRRIRRNFRQIRTGDVKPFLERSALAPNLSALLGAALAAKLMTAAQGWLKTLAPPLDARPALGEGPRGAPRGVPALSLAPSLANQKKEVAVC